MRLTNKQVMQDNKRFANCNAFAELKYCGWDIPHRKSITNDEIHFYAWLCRSAVALLKEQKARIKKYEYLFDFLGIGFREWATKILDGEAEVICEADEHEHKTVITFKLI